MMATNNQQQSKNMRNSIKLQNLRQNKTAMFYSSHVAYFFFINIIAYCVLATPQ